MWEYNRFEIKFRNFFELNEELNRLGHDGWEIIYYFENIETKLNDIHKSNILIKRKVA